jgi:hypothetical protein
MAKTISPDDALILKKPFGTLVADKELSKRKVASMLKGAKKVIAVGDATTERLLSFGIVPHLAVIDGRERRSKRRYPNSYHARELSCVNPKGTISGGAVAALQDALKSTPPVRVIVDGEEDMLALPLFKMAPKGSIVLYGQPLEGIVFVKITPPKKRYAKDLIERFVSSQKNRDNVIG